MKNAILERLSNGAEAFSPDGQWILGQAPELENYYVAAGDVMVCVCDVYDDDLSQV